MTVEEVQSIKEINADDLSAEANSLKAKGYRLIQILCLSVPEGWELSYSFGLEFEMISIRFTLGNNNQIKSITPIYAAAYLYENEVRDLFGVPIEGISLDWKGKVYEGAQDRPFKKITIVPPSSEKGTMPDSLKEGIK